MDLSNVTTIRSEKAAYVIEYLINMPHSCNTLILYTNFNTSQSKGTYKDYQPICYVVKTPLGMAECTQTPVETSSTTCLSFFFGGS